MARSLTANMLTELQSSSIIPIILIRAFFDSGPLNLWTGVGTITIDGIDYIGTGILLNISDLTETQDLSATNFTISLSGLPTEVISLAYEENYQDRPCSMSLGLLKRLRTGYHLRENGGYALMETPELTAYELREDGGNELREDGGFEPRQESGGSGDSEESSRLKMEAREGNFHVVEAPYEFFSGLMDVMTIDEGATTTTVALSVEHELVDGDRVILRKWSPEDHAIDYTEDTGFDYMAGLQQKQIIWNG